MDIDIIKQRLGDKLKFNLLTSKVELDGQEVDLNTDQDTLRDSFDIKTSGKQSAYGYICFLAQKNSYHPVYDYLESNYRKQQPQNTFLLDTLANKYLGAEHDIYNLMLKKTLVSAVARIYGVMVKNKETNQVLGSNVWTSLILEGDKGIGKSDFFRTLASDSFFGKSDRKIIDSTKKLVKELHLTWIFEWSELGRPLKGYYKDRVKHFMSRDDDEVKERIQSQTRFDRLKRHSILVGTANKKLVTEASQHNWRFWILPVTVGIDLGQLSKERDQIWAEACLAYQQGEKWWFEYEEEQKIKEFVLKSTGYFRLVNTLFLVVKS